MFISWIIFLGTIDPSFFLSKTIDSLFNYSTLSIEGEITNIHSTNFNVNYNNNNNNNNNY